MYEIKKILIDSLEVLPDITETPLWQLIDPDVSPYTKKTDRQLARLYEAISKRENYFQGHSPTPFGNPDYSLYCGVVAGILLAMEAHETVENEQIIIRTNQAEKKILVVDKPKLSASYYECVKENKNILAAIGG